MDASSSIQSPLLKLDADERARVLGLAWRMRSARGPALALLLPVLISCVFTFGPLVVPFVVALLAGFAVLGSALRRPQRPERPLVLSLVWAQLMIVGMIAVATRFGIDELGLLILPAAASCLLLPERMAAGFLGWTTLLMAATALLIDADRVASSPPILILPIGALLCVSLPAVMVRRVEVTSRDSAVTDALTGASNRIAFELRLLELTEQAHAAPLHVGVLMADLDHFKSINDELGHAAGDDVLRETVRRIRNELGPLTAVYRIGGEEFVVLVSGSGSNAEAVATLGERVRRAVSSDLMHDRSVTVSVGVAHSISSQHEVKELIELADGALYDAKQAGRDRVVVADLASEPVVPAAGAAASPLSVVERPERGQGSPEVRREALAAGPLSARSADRNFLIRGEFEREHIRSSARAMARTHHGALGMIGLALASSIPWLGYQLMLPAILPVVAYHVVERRIRKIRRPELALGAAWTSVQIAIFFGALIVDNGQPYMLILFVPMMISVTAVFPSRGILIATLITITLTTVGAMLARPDLFSVYPGLAAPPILIVSGFALMSSVAGRSAIESRTTAVVDPLTGLLTRAALESRLEDLSRQSVLDTAAVSVIVFDVDAFKALNDTYGHATGDAVLKAVGAATRQHLGALEWGFRLGGDEFVIVVPAGEDVASKLASTLRAALSGIDVDGVGITGSFGVAAAPVGRAFDFAAVSHRADMALYEAKKAGRNRVAVAPPGLPAAIANVA